MLIKHGVLKVLRNLHDWEIAEYNNLLLCLDKIKLTGKNDERIWKLDSNRGFSV